MAAFNPEQPYYWNQALGRLGKFPAKTLKTVIGPRIDGREAFADLRWELPGATIIELLDAPILTVDEVLEDDKPLAFQPGAVIAATIFSRGLSEITQRIPGHQARRGRYSTPLDEALGIEGKTAGKVREHFRKSGNFAMERAREAFMRHVLQLGGGSIMLAQIPGNPGFNEPGNLSWRIQRQQGDHGLHYDRLKTVTAHLAHLSRY